MVQILWKSNAPHSSTQDHELVELRLIDLGVKARSRYLVREIHASWSAAAQQIQWRGFKDRRFGTPQEASCAFASRKACVTDSGFLHVTVLN